jgi:hypothetical protein
VGMARHQHGVWQEYISEDPREWLWCGFLLRAYKHFRRLLQEVCDMII